MPILKSAKKAHKKSLKNKAANLVWKRKYKTAIKDAFLAIEKKLASSNSERSKDAGTKTSLAISLIDKVSKRQINIIHKNKASRLKSRLMKKLGDAKIKSVKREIIAQVSKKPIKPAKTKKVANNKSSKTKKPAKPATKKSSAKKSVKK